jgi:hypothetical protein
VFYDGSHGGEVYKHERITSVKPDEAEVEVRPRHAISLIRLDICIDLYNAMK